jgi:hypothetical protein
MAHAAWQELLTTQLMSALVATPMPVNAQGAPLLSTLVAQAFAQLTGSAALPALTMQK